MDTGQLPTSKPSILITEDDKTTLDILHLIVSKKFPEVTIYVAEDGVMGLELFKLHSPDVVITDINMPMMDGIVMSKEVKLIKADTKFIVLTGYSDRNYKEEFGSNIGYHDFIMKPIDFSKLIASIEQCLAEVAPKH